jgi:hypothetical protein
MELAFTVRRVGHPEALLRERGPNRPTPIDDLAVPTTTPTTRPLNPFPVVNPLEQVRSVHLAFEPNAQPLSNPSIA